MRHKILVVEDDREIAGLVALHLREEGWAVDRAADGRAALAHLRARAYDLVVLDLMLPDMDGLDLCRTIRSRADDPPILILTARTSELDRVVGLELGADDYVTKPFSVRELVARVRALFRRVDKARAGDHAQPLAPIEAFGLVLDPERRRVTVDGQSVQLTAKEFDLLHHFASHPGRVYSRAQLLDLVWGYGHDGYEHTVNSHVNRLRAKIEADPAAPRYIRTVWGVGYKFPDGDDWAEE